MCKRLPDHDEMTSILVAVHINCAFLSLNGRCRGKGRNIGKHDSSAMAQFGGSLRSQPDLRFVKFSRLRDITFIAFFTHLHSL